MNFNELCKNARYSDNEIARKLGVSHDTIYLWRKGVREPKAKYIAPLAKLLGVTESDVLKAFER